MTCSAIKRIFITALLLFAMLVSVISLFPLRSFAAGQNENAVGTDFTLLPSGTVYNKSSASADTETIKDDDGNVLFTLNHPGSSSFTARSMLMLNGANGAKPYVSFSAAGLFVSGKSYVVDIAARFNHNTPLTSGSELLLIDLVGKNSGGSTVSFAPVKLTSSGYLSYYNGSSYVESGVYLSNNQWKKISVVFKITSGNVKFDVYFLENLIAENITAPVSFASVSEVRTLEITGTGCACTAYLNYLWMYEGGEPEYGSYPQCDEGKINACADFSEFENGTTLFDAYENEKMRIQPYGNPATVFVSGKNPYLSVSRLDYSPYLDIYSFHDVSGKTQVFEAAIKLDSSWSAEANIFSPFTYDKSEIALRAPLLKVNSSGVLLLNDGTTVGILKGQSAVISLVLHYDRATFDVYVDGNEAATKVKFPSAGFDRIDGLRVFEFTGTGSGTIAVDYAVMYSGITPATKTSGDDGLVYENSFCTQNVLSDCAPLSVSGSLINTESFDGSYRLALKKTSSSQLSYLSLPVTPKKDPLYVEYTFTFASLSKNLTLLSLNKGNEEVGVLAYVNPEGWLCVDGENNATTRIRKLDMNFKYRFIAQIDTQNGFYNIYLNNSPLIAFQSLSDKILSGFDKIVMFSTASDGKVTATLDDLFVYQRPEAFDELKEPEFDFSLSVTEDGKIRIVWDELGPAAGYTIWKTTSAFATPEKISDVLYGTTEFFDPDVEEDNSYYYRVCLTVKNGDKEIHYGESADMKYINAKIPESAYHLNTPSGYLPEYTSKEILTEDFSADETSLTLYSANCAIDNTTETLKILNPSDSTTIPYFAIETLKYKKSNIIDFEMKYSREKNNITLCSVYTGLTHVTTIAKIKDNVLVTADDTKLLTLKENETYRITLWLDLNCANAALFVNGACVLENVPIAEFKPVNSQYTVRFCSVYGENVLTVDNFKVLETRTYLTNYTSPALAPYATVSENSNSVSWTSFKGCEYYTVWCASSENGTYSVLEEELDHSFLFVENVESSRYYKITYTFDTLGVELTVPLSSVASAEMIREEIVIIPKFIDFSEPATVQSFVISIAALACITAVLLPEFLKKTKKKDN